MRATGLLASSPQPRPRTCLFVKPPHAVDLQRDDARNRGARDAETALSGRAQDCAGVRPTTLNDEASRATHLNVAATLAGRARAGVSFCQPSSAALAANPQ